jgi:L-threonylcarbamoyladenylate synthase
MVSDFVSAGLSTVGVRMPSHPVALALIIEAGLPIAAPSANLSGKPSATCAEHVIYDMNGRVDLIIDSGASELGLESTVIDVTSFPPVILRPGGVTIEQISQIIPGTKIDLGIIKNEDSAIPKAPGMKYKHYSPDAKVIIVKGKYEDVADKINDILINMKSDNKKIGIMATDETIKRYDSMKACIISVGSRQNRASIAYNLFDVLRKFDQSGMELVLAEAIEESDIGFAIMNRMNKASGYDVIEV